MSGSFRITELHPEIQQVISQLNLDTGPGGVADGVLTEADLPGINRAISALERGGNDKARQDAALLRSLIPATRGGLAVPRPDSAGQRVRSAIDFRPTPGDRIQELSTTDLRTATVDERVEMIKHIIDHTGYNWWSGRVNNPREQRIIAILTTTPEHQRGALVGALFDSPNLIGNMQSAIDGDESTQFRAFMQANMYAIESPANTALVIHQLGVNSEAELLNIARQLRERRDDRFADAVLTQLVGMRDLQHLMPYVFWTAPSPDCESGSDVAVTLAWEGTLKAQRAMHQTQFNQLLQSFPPGNAAAMLREQFEQRHNIQDIMAGVNIAACVLQAITKNAGSDDPPAHHGQGSRTGLPTTSPRRRHHD